MALITDGEVARLRARLGSTVSVSEPPYLTEVARDSVRHWAWGTGDRNPLYLDRDFACSVGHADVIGPPAMLYAFSRLSVGYRGGLPGVHSAFGGSWWKWRQPLRLGTVVSSSTVFTDLKELPSRFAGKMLKQVATTRFKDQQGQELAEVESWGLRFERRSERRSETERQKPLREPIQVTEEQIADISQRYQEEAARLPGNLQWDAIQEGDALPTIIRGPYSSTCAVVFEQAWGGSFLWAHGYWYDYLRRHPGASMRNASGVPEPAEAVHWDANLARKVGVADAYDYGPERVAWIATLLTNWAGTGAFLSQLYCEVRQFNLGGNVTLCSGRVASKTGDASNGTVRVEVAATDRQGSTTATGWAELVFSEGNLVPQGANF